jgi:molybdate transport system substrate-binding protein
VFVLTDAGIDDLVRQGLVVPGTRVDLARTAVGVGVRRGAPLPDISTPDALRDTLLRVLLRLHRSGARRHEWIHFADVLRRLGIAEVVRDKAVLWPGGSAAEAVVRGQAELVVHQSARSWLSRASRWSVPCPPRSRRSRLTRRGSQPGARRPGLPAT